MRHSSLISAVVGVVCLSCVNNGYAKSVFAIASHDGSEVKAYSIDPNSAITYQATVDQTESFGAGAGALCLWPSKDRMFITYEEGNGVIAWASIKNLSRDSETDKYFPGVGELAGMLVDENKDLLYALKRTSTLSMLNCRV